MTVQAGASVPWLRVSVVIPALNEARNLPHVFARLPPNVHEVIVVDNGSIDRTAEVAAARGAKVVCEKQSGYGRACAAGVAIVDQRCDILILMDGDYAYHPEEMPKLIGLFALPAQWATQSASLG